MELFLRLWLALALQPSPDLTVTLHDVAGVPLVGITVTIHDTGGQVLAQDTTGAGGTAIFARLPVSDVQVTVAGHFQDGTALRLPPSDAGGIAVYLTSGTVLNLIADIDGVVILNPATMWAREEAAPAGGAATARAGAPAVVFPTAPPLPAPSAATLVPAGIVAPPPRPAPAALTIADPAPAAAAEGSELPLLVLSVLAVLGLALMVFWYRWRAS